MKRLIQKICGHYIQKYPVLSRRVAQFIIKKTDRNTQPNIQPKALLQLMNQLSAWSDSLDPHPLIQTLVLSGFVTESGLHAYLVQIFMEGKRSLFKKIIDDEKIGFSELRTYHRIRESFSSGKSAYSLSEIDAFYHALTQKNVFIKRATLDLLLQKTIQNGELEYLISLVTSLKSTPKSISKTSMLGICRLMIQADRHTLCAELLVRYLKHASFTVQLYFLEPLHAVKHTLLAPPRWLRPILLLQDGRAVLHAFREAHAGLDPQGMLQQFILNPLEMLLAEPHALMDIRFSKPQQERLLGIIANHLARKQSFSLIRLGDGEAYAYAAPFVLPNADNTLWEEDNRRRELRWWGVEIAPVTRLWIQEGVRLAISQADCLGLPTIYRVIRDCETMDRSFYDTQAKRSLLVVLGALATQQILPHNKYITEDRCHHILFSKETLQNLSHQASRVLVVSCWEEAQLHFTFACPAEYIVIPAHAQFRAHFPDDAPKLYDQHAVILEKIKSHTAPGTLVLVGAGIIGKILIRAAKEAGAVALDVGAMFDYFAGYKSRSVVDLV